MTENKADEIIVRLEKLLEEGNQSVFSSDEADLLKKLAKFFIALTALGRPGMVILKILGYIAAMIIAWAAFRSGVGDILRGFLNG